METEYFLLLKRDSLMFVQDSVYNKFLIQRGHLYMLIDYSAQLNKASVHSRIEHEELANEISRREISYEAPDNPYPRLTFDSLWIFAKSVSIESPISFGIEISSNSAYLSSILTSIKLEDELSVQIQQREKNIEKLKSDIAGTEASIAALRNFLGLFPSYIKYYNLGIKYHRNVMYNQDANYQAMQKALNGKVENRDREVAITYDGEGNWSDNAPSAEEQKKISSIMEDMPVATDEFYLNYEGNKETQKYWEEGMLNENPVFKDSVFDLSIFIRSTCRSQKILAELQSNEQLEFTFVINQAGNIHAVKTNNNTFMSYEFRSEIDRIASLMPGLTPPIRNNKIVNASIRRKVNLK